MKYFVLLLLLPLHLIAQKFTPAEVAKWKKQAANITIIRDNYGVPHIYGKTDADAVFGLLYAQCEDDFSRVEMNYIEKLGRMAEVEGEGQLYQDLLNRLVIDTAASQKDYKKAPLWLQKILNAYADGINYFLVKHSQVKPALLTRFQPWYPLMWTDGSIGAITTGGISENELKNFYSGKDELLAKAPYEAEKTTGSNGFAFSPKITESGNAILYINPHVTFYFRPEVHMVSNEGMNAYGAVTWGQPFVYQGFNQHCGWMHTSSLADISDAYIEKITKQNNGLFYEYDGKQRPVGKKVITLKYKEGSKLVTKTFNTLYTHHGPVMAKRNGKYLSLRHNNRDMQGFMQSWLRTKATSFNAFKKTMDMHANPSNNTVYADGEGNIAYWHGNFLPKRDAKYDWNLPVDGSTSATEWKGMHTVNESVHVYNPENGWLQNCNSSPFAVAGKYSPRRSDYAAYLAPDGENFRGVNAVRVLGEEKKYTIDKVIKAGYDTRLTAFELLIPALLRAYVRIGKGNDSLHEKLKAPIAELQTWDYRSGVNSVATTLAVEWGQRLLPAINKTVVPQNVYDDMVAKAATFAEEAMPGQLLEPLMATIKDLEARYGTWQMPWGEINRFQRISSDINNKFDDNKLSLPDGFVSSTWGMLPSFNSRTFAGTKKRYGYNGNSFIAAVEFGKKIKAKSLLAGGQSGHEDSPHFFDQGEAYTKGQFKEVLFYKEDVMKHAEKTYHPGEK